LAFSRTAPSAKVTTELSRRVPEAPVLLADGFTRQALLPPGVLVGDAGGAAADVSVSVLGPAVVGSAVVGSDVAGDAVAVGLGWDQFHQRQ